MTWRLRDRKIQEKLDEVTNGDFSKRLNEVVISGAMKFCFAFGGSKFTMHLMGNDIEEIPEYNPKAWNEWPGITPPVEEMMRVDCFDERGTLIHSCCGYWNGKCWMTWNGYKLNDARTIRFRSWEE